MIEPRAHITEMRSKKYWLDETGRLKGKNPLASDLQDSIQHLAEGLYSKDVHFIFELIQNAEDNAYEVREPSLSFRLVKTDPTGTKNSNGALIVQNNEVGFSTDNVNAICAVGKTTKSKAQGYIGEKGIGFKSVFRVTTNPYIFSNGYRFRLPEHDEETGLGYIVPNWVEDVPKGIEPSLTTIVLPLDKTGFGHGTIEEMLRDIKPETILFLSKLKEIQIETDTGDTLTILKDDSKSPKVQILVEGKSQGESFSIVDEFLLYSKSFEKPQNITHEKRIGIDNRDATIAFPLGEDKKNTDRIFAYLPVNSDSGLPFLINADFILTSSREDVREDEPWNQWLMCCVAELVGNALSQLKERSLLTIRLLEALACRMREISEKSIFYPIVQSVADAFKREAILPADNNSFVKANCAKLARSSDLRKLLNREQLSMLFKSSNVLNWLSAEITQYLTPNLRLYMTEQLNIEAVRPEKFAELISDDFLENQDDKWIIAFYTFLGKDRQENLWKKPDSVLMKKKIIRLENNTHVIPFKNDGTPNVYLPSTANTNFPTVKKTVFEVETASDFLKQLGLIKPDLFAEIIEFILPKYAEDIIKVEFAENIDDLRKIQKVLSEPYIGNSASTISKLRILLTKLGLRQLDDYFSSNAESGKLIPILLQKLVLPSIRVLKAFNGHTTAYKAPKDIYINNDELQHYFSDNTKAWFFCRDYPGEIESLSHKIGINKLPKVKKRDADKNGFVKISEWRGYHRRGLFGFDPDIEVEGLSIALSSPATEKSLFIWNKIVSPNAECIRGTIEKSSRQTYENSSKEEHISESFGRLLIENKWLPGPDGIFYCPSELSLDELPNQFERDEKLDNLLRMRKTEKVKAADILSEGDPRKKKLLERIANASDGELERFEKLVPRTNPPNPAPSFREGIANMSRHQGGNPSPKKGGQDHPVRNPERYQNNLDDDVTDGIKKHTTIPHTVQFSPVRDKPNNKEAREFLYVEYHGQCQIKGTTFTKAAANSEGIPENYFEACSLLPYSNACYLNDPGNMLCVSADTMAKLKYASFEWLDDIKNKVAEFEDGGRKAKCIGIKIKLAGEECFITWSQRHFMRLVSLYKQT